MVDNMNRDEMIASYTMVDYKNYDDIQGQGHYVTINGKLLVLGFEPFPSSYISIRLSTMTVVKYLLVNTKKNLPKKIYYHG